ncbi:MAG: hypothetical protein JWP89_2284 [Schlesneria sp.]|nr:hypothetical protein [Schlesneria sp.]
MHGEINSHDHGWQQNYTAGTSRCREYSHPTNYFATSGFTVAPCRAIRQNLRRIDGAEWTQESIDDSQIDSVDLAVFADCTDASPDALLHPPIQRVLGQAYWCLEVMKPESMTMCLSSLE